MVYSGQHWREEEANRLRATIYDDYSYASYLCVDGKGNDEERPWLPNRSKVNDVIDALKSVSYIGGDLEPPSFLTGTDTPDPSHIVSCRNGLLDVTSRKLYDHTPDFFTRVSVPFDFDPVAPRPGAWLNFIEELWDGEDEKLALQEVFGYLISGRSDLHKIPLFVGPPRAGKGTIARVLTELMGKRNVASPTLASFSTNFGLSPLISRPVAIISDARLEGAENSTVVERLLTISGEDSITIDRKYREPWTGRLPTRIVIMSNELPRLGDASAAIASRFLLLQLTRSWGQAHGSGV